MFGVRAPACDPTAHALIATAEFWMFGAYSSTVLSAMRRANAHALSAHHNFIRVEDVLIGLAEEESSFAAAILAKAGITTADIRARALHDVQAYSTDEAASLTLIQDIMNGARAESTRRGDAQIGTGHVLLSILRAVEPFSTGQLHLICPEN